jgi:energy-converting hydrogenase Eha subunit A
VVISSEREHDWQSEPPSPEPARHKHRAATARRRPARSLIVGSVAVVVLLIATALVLTLRSRDSARPQHSTAALSAPVDAPVVTPAMTWISANLSKAAVLVSDPSTVAALHAAGFTAAISYADSSSRPLPKLDYLLWIPGTSASAPVAALLSNSLPLAVFSADEPAPTLRQIFPAGLTTAQDQQAKDAALRTSGGQQLAQNPHIVPDAGIAALLSLGRLDLRAENVVSALAATGQIWLSVETEDPSEQRAGLPVRIVTVTAADPQAASVTLASLTPPYRPARIDTIAPDKFRLTWAPQLNAVAIAGG